MYNPVSKLEYTRMYYNVTMYIHVLVYCNNVWPNWPSSLVVLIKIYSVSIATGLHSRDEQYSSHVTHVLK